jgi:hypothetical protein
MSTQASGDLIARLEKATGEDRELANDVLLACGWKTEEYGAGPDRSVTWIDPNPNGEDYLDGDQPDPTASLDAARTLILPGFYWLVSEGRTRASEPLGGAQIFRPNYLVEPIAEAEHESAIIALCIAALRARDAQAGSGR